MSTITNEYPIPPARKYPFAEMAVGQSFDTPGCVQGYVGSAAYTYRIRHLRKTGEQRKFRVRTLCVDEQRGIFVTRCWRIK